MVGQSGSLGATVYQAPAESQYANVLQFCQGSSPYSQRAADPRGVQGVPAAGSVAGHGWRAAGQETSLSL